MLTDKSFSHRKGQSLLSNLTLCHLLDTSMHAWGSLMDSGWMDGWTNYNVYC